MVSKIKGTGEYSDFNGRRAIAGGHTYRGPHMVEAMVEAGAHNEVHHKDAVAERKRREKSKRYEAMKAELAAKRAAASD